MKWLYHIRLFFRGFAVRRNHTIDEIQLGDYCYVITEVINGGERLKTKPCPYLDYNPYAEDQNYGYCHLLKRGDYDHSEVWLLWDACKECNLNVGDEDYE